MRHILDFTLRLLEVPFDRKQILLKTEERAYHLAHFLAKDSLTLGFVQRTTN